MTKIVIANGPPDCVDADTEFLTEVGWKRISDFEVGDKVCAVSQDGSAWYETPAEFLKSLEDVKLNKFEGTYSDMVLTDNHRVVYKTGKTGKWSEKVASEFVSILSSNKYGFDGKIPCSFNLVSEEYEITDDELRFIVMFSAEANLRNVRTGNSCISIKHDYKKVECERLLRSLNYDYTTSEFDYAPGFKRYYFYSQIEKGIPEFFYKLSKRQREIVSEALVFWDGDCKDIYRTTLKHEADIAQFIFSSLGFQTSVRVDDRLGDKYGGGYIRKSVCYEVRKITPRPGNFGMESLTIGEEMLGKAYCFKVSTGMWLARRNFKIFVTGNCGKDEAIAYLKRQYGVHTFSFKTELKALTLKLYCVSEALWDSWYTRTGKELPRKELDGLSCRQALIRVSEMIVKPNFGKGYFGKAEGTKLKALADAGELIAACSDGGFNEEIDPLIDLFGEDNIHILQIRRPGRSFEGDSRSWITHPKIPEWNYWTIENNGTIDAYWSALDVFWQMNVIEGC